MQALFSGFTGDEASIVFPLANNIRIRRTISKRVARASSPENGIEFVILLLVPEIEDEYVVPTLCYIYERAEYLRTTPGGKSLSKCCDNFYDPYASENYDHQSLRHLSQWPLIKYCNDN